MAKNRIRPAGQVRILKENLRRSIQGCRQALKMTGSILALFKINRFNSYNLGNFTGSNVPIPKTDRFNEIC